jgi:hypothetical protein
MIIKQDNCANVVDGGDRCHRALFRATGFD